MTNNEQGPDIIIRDSVTQVGLIVESEVGHNITDHSCSKFVREARQLAEKKLKAIIVIRNSKKSLEETHGRHQTKK